MPNFSIGGFDYYMAPKNAGTTVRMWLKYFEGTLPADFETDGYCTLAKVGMPEQWVDTVMVAEPFFKPGSDQNQQWCIVRDPVDRFVSAYTDKIMFEKLMNWDLETCLSLLETGEMERIAQSSDATVERQVACHFIPQHYWFGRQNSYFDHVFRFEEMDRVKAFCENQVFKMPLPGFHGRDLAKAGVDRVSLSPAQRDRLAHVFAEDYRLGWC